MYCFWGHIVFTLADLVAWVARCARQVHVCRILSCFPLFLRSRKSSEKAKRWCRNVGWENYRCLTASWLSSKRPITQMAGYNKGYGCGPWTRTTMLSFPAEQEWVKKCVCTVTLNPMCLPVTHFFLFNPVQVHSLTTFHVYSLYCKAQPGKNAVVRSCSAV